MGWVHWPSAHRSKSFFLVAFACRMTPSSSLYFLYGMFLLIAWFVPISIFMSIVENVYCICQDRVICFDISYMFPVSYF